LLPKGREISHLVESLMGGELCATESWMISTGHAVVLVINTAFVTLTSPKYALSATARPFNS